MTARLRLKDVRDDVAEAVNLGSDDERVPIYVNQACEGLLYEMKSVGTYPRYEVCVNANCITWPRQIETIEAACVCKRPAMLRNNWFEFLYFGPGRLTEGRDIGNQMVDAGEASSFDNVTGQDKKLAVYCDNDEEAGSAIILQYYDKDGNWVRTKPVSEWIDGESITLPAAGNYATTALQVMPNGFVRAIKPVTNGVVRLYEFDTVNNVYKPLAYYEPDEEVPVYRRSLIPGLTTRACCERTAPKAILDDQGHAILDDQGHAILESSGCNKISVTVVAKLRFIPVAKDNDFLCIAHRRAVRLAAQAVFKEKADKPEEALKFWALAIAALKKQLEHHLGHGAVQPLNMVGTNVWGGHVPVLH